MSRTVDMVGRFHKAFQCYNAPRPEVLEGVARPVLLEAVDRLTQVTELLKKVGTDVRASRLALIVEETAELVSALARLDLVATLDAFVDLRYVCDGGLFNFGLVGAFDEAFRRVHLSNMSKLGTDGRPIINSSTGKVIKGPNYVAPVLDDLVTEEQVTMTKDTARKHQLGMHHFSREIYVSTDVEADGPIPGPHSMLSIGSAAFFDDGTLVDTYTANLMSLPGASPDPSTAEWWAQPSQAFAWAAVNKDRQDPSTAMREYVEWLKDLPGKVVFVGYPVGFDFTFVYWYLMKFVGESPFSFSAIDMKTMAMTMLKTNYRETSKRTMPRRWFLPSTKHTHVALDDAIEQGTTFCIMLKENRAGSVIP